MTELKSNPSLFKLILHAPNLATQPERMSRAAALLIGFYILHSIPNVFLLLSDGEEQYDSKAKDIHKIPGLILFELYFTVGFAVHASLAVKTALNKPVSTLLLTGIPLGAFIALHLADFRLSDFQTGTKAPHEVELAP